MAIWPLRRARSRTNSQLDQLADVRKSTRLTTEPERVHRAQAGPLNQLELPGQYGGDEAPHPETHVLAECFGQEMLVIRVDTATVFTSVSR